MEGWGNQREGKKCMICKGDGGDRKMANNRERVLASEDIINYTHTLVIWPACKKNRSLGNKGNHLKSTTHRIHPSAIDAYHKL